jgi:hypothetical protein
MQNGLNNGLGFWKNAQIQNQGSQSLVPGSENYGPNTGFDFKSGLGAVQAGAGLLGAYTGLKGLGLAQDQFAFNKASANRDVANQASLINESRLNAANVGLGLAGNTMSDAQRAATRARISAGNVDGSRLG